MQLLALLRAAAAAERHHPEGLRHLPGVAPVQAGSGSRFGSWVLQWHLAHRGPRLRRPLPLPLPLPAHLLLPTRPCCTAAPRLCWCCWPSRSGCTSSCAPRPSSAGSGGCWAVTGVWGMVRGDGRTQRPLNAQPARGVGLCRSPLHTSPHSYRHPHHPSHQAQPSVQDDHLHRVHHAAGGWGVQVVPPLPSPPLSDGAEL